jgi:hypothetical protein
MTVKITRRRALELAQECMAERMRILYPKMIVSTNDREKFGYDPRAETEYAELAAALQVIENMARQKEMHL